LSTFSSRNCKADEECVARDLEAVFVCMIAVLLTEWGGKHGKSSGEKGAEECK
jgi:hypothetical protein